MPFLYCVFLLNLNSLTKLVLASSVVSISHYIYPPLHLPKRSWYLTVYRQSQTCNSLLSMLNFWLDISCLLFTWHCVRYNHNNNIFWSWYKIHSYTGYIVKWKTINFINVLGGTPLHPNSACSLLPPIPGRHHHRCCT